MSWNLTCKDIMDYTAFPDYTFILCDPPWQDKMVKFFQTQLQKDTGAVVRHSIKDILTKLASLASKEKPIFVAYSVDGLRELIDIFQAEGHHVGQIFPAKQLNGKPYVKVSFNTSYKFSGDHVGFTSVTKLIKDHPGATVFDPFAGIGKTAQAVVNAGGHYIGSELNPKRLEKAIKRMQK